MLSDYLIVANGNFLVREILLEAAAGRVILVLDGAAHIMPPQLESQREYMRKSEKERLVLQRPGYYYRPIP